MYGRAHTEIVCSLKIEARQNCTLRKGVGILPNEEEHSKEMTAITYVRQSFWVFVSIWPIISFLFPHLTCTRTLPNMHEQRFPGMDVTAKACGVYPHLL